MQSEEGRTKCRVCRLQHDSIQHLEETKQRLISIVKPSHSSCHGDSCETPRHNTLVFIQPIRIYSLTVKDHLGSRWFGDILRHVEMPSVSRTPRRMSSKTWADCCDYFWPASTDRRTIQCTNAPQVVQLFGWSFISNLCCDFIYFVFGLPWQTQGEFKLDQAPFHTDLRHSAKQKSWIWWFILQSLSHMSGSCSFRVQINHSVQPFSPFSLWSFRMILLTICFGRAHQLHMLLPMMTILGILGQSMLIRTLDGMSRLSQRCMLICWRFLHILLGAFMMSTPAIPGIVSA